MHLTPLNCTLRNGSAGEALTWRHSGSRSSFLGLSNSTIQWGNLSRPADHGSAVRGLAGVGSGCVPTGHAATRTLARHWVLPCGCPKDLALRKHQGMCGEGAALPGGRRASPASSRVCASSRPTPARRRPPVSL